MNPAKVLAVTVLAGTLSIGIALYGQHLFQDSDGTAPAPGADAAGQIATLPDLKLPDLTGREVLSNAWAGRVIVLHYWATWCAACEHELLALDALQRAHGKQALQVVGIAIDQPEEVARFMAERPLDIQVLTGGIEAIDIARKLGNRTDALPFTVIFDAIGRRVFSQAGELGNARLDAEVAALLPAVVPGGVPGG